MIRDGRFREDLYYRINTMHLMLPPLRERTDEIKELALSFLHTYATKYGRQVQTIAQPVLESLRLHRWSGNIRELKNTIEKAVIMSEGDTLTMDDLQLSIPSGGQQNISDEPKPAMEYYGETLEMQEEKTIRAAMEKCGGNLTLVAKTLNISRPTLYSKLKKYGI